MMNTFCSIETDGLTKAPSPLSVTHRLSNGDSTRFDFEYYKLEIKKNFSVYLEKTHQTFFYLFFSLYYFEKLELIQKSHKILEFINVNQQVLNAIFIGGNIANFLQTRKVFLHPGVLCFLSQTEPRLLTENLGIVKNLTQIYIAALQKIFEEQVNPKSEYQFLKIFAKDYIKKQQDLHANVIANEKLLIEASERELLDEETRDSLTHMQYHHTLMKINPQTPHSKHDQTCDDEDYGQFIDLESDDSLLVYISKINDFSPEFLSKHDAEDELKNIPSPHQSAHYRFFFDKGAFDLRAANGIVNEPHGQQDKGIVYQFY